MTVLPLIFSSIMKHLNYFNITIGCIAFVLAYLAGYYVASSKHIKDYEAACFFADVVHCAMDSEDAATSEEVMEIYSDFASGIDSANFRALKVEHLKEYYWCY